MCCLWQEKVSSLKVKTFIKQLDNTYHACRPFTKHCERIQDLRERGTLKHLYSNKLDKACFANDAAYSDSNNLPNWSVSDKILKGTAYEIPKNSKNDAYERALASMLYRFSDKKPCIFSWNRILAF